MPPPLALTRVSLMQSSFPVTFYIHNHSERSKFQAIHTGLAALPASRAWFCLKCGNVWARMVMEGGENAWVVTHSLCSKCDISYRDRSAITWNFVPGSIWPEWFDEDLVAAIPPSILKREFQLHLQHWVKHHAESPA